MLILDVSKNRSALVWIIYGSLLWVNEYIYKYVWH